MRLCIAAVLTAALLPLGAAHGGIMIITPGRLNLPVTRKLLRWAGEASGCRLPRQEGD